MYFIELRSPLKASPSLGIHLSWIFVIELSIIERGVREQKLGSGRLLPLENAPSENFPSPSGVRRR